MELASDRNSGAPFREFANIALTKVSSQYQAQYRLDLGHESRLNLDSLREKLCRPF